MIHLINMLPTPVLQGKSPYFVLYRKESDYDYLRVFGCYCYPYLRLFNNQKLELKFEPCTFLGYNAQYKGYHCLSPNGKVVVS